MSEVAYYMEHLPIIEARKHYSTAQLNADLREFIFPRYTAPDPKQKGPPEPPRPRELWRVEELFPPFAWLEKPKAIPVDAAQALVHAFEHLPDWAQKLAPMGDAMNVLNVT